MAADSNGSSIKLFGKTIPFPLQQPEGDLPNSCKEISDENGTTSLHERKPGPEKEEQKCYKKEIAGNRISDNNSSSNQMTKDSKYRTSSSGNSENPKTESEKETSSLKCSKNTEQSDSSTSQEKAPKKPDKILPCPRCNSMETKFCYHNNYNVNQPRHFCKNCQRYWTAGGTMRNMPVGSGRRKKKSSSASQYRQMMVVPEALRTTQARAGNGTFLTFGFESPLCESAASVLSLSEETRNIVRNGYHGPENKVLASGGGSADNGNDKSRGSITNSLNSSSEKRNGSSSQQAAARKSHQGFPQPFSSFAGPPWPCPWNLAMPAPTSCPSGFPVSFCPTPIWGYTVPSPWNAPPLVTPTSLPSPLGKHSRDGKILFPASPEVHPKGSNSSERNILVLKTLGIDDPREAAKSSIWKTIDNKMENIGSVTRGGLFMGFQSQIEDRNSMMIESSKVLQANPAAFSRSLKFHEST